MSVHLDIDTSAARTVLSVLEGTPIPICPDTGIRLLIQSSCKGSYSVDEFLERAKAWRQVTNKEVEDDFPHFRWHPEQVRTFLAELENNSCVLKERVEDLVSQYIPNDELDVSTTLHLVYGGKTDAYAEYIAQELHAVVELNAVLSQEEPHLWIDAAISHEIWHVLFAEYVKHFWQIKKPHDVRDLDYSLVYTMVDEGLAHYVGMVAYLGEDVTTEMLLDYAEKEDGFYERFRSKIERFMISSDTEKEELIRESHLGDMWGKWGAMTGALVVGELRRTEGKQGILTAISQDPYSLWFLYDAQTKNYALGPHFLDLVRGIHRKEVDGLLK